jgi:regulatory protein
MMPHRPISALDKALRLLSARAYSSGELNQRLIRAGYPQEEAAAAVEECRRHHYLDDRMFAEDCAEMWLERGHGALSIRQKLRQRGVSAEFAAEALNMSKEQETEAAYRAIESKLPSLFREKDHSKRQAKALRFLVARGFSGDVLRDAMRYLDTAIKDREEQSD